MHLVVIWLNYWWLFRLYQLGAYICVHVCILMPACTSVIYHLLYNIRSSTKGGRIFFFLTSSHLFFKIEIFNEIILEKRNVFLIILICFILLHKCYCPLISVLWPNMFKINSARFLLCVSSMMSSDGVQTRLLISFWLHVGFMFISIWYVICESSQLTTRECGTFPPSSLLEEVSAPAF